MLPASTCSPPNFFSPRRLLCESRPFLVLPPAFLCAMVSPSDPDSGAQDAGDPDFGIRLPVRALTQVVLAPAEFHDPYLVALPVRLDRSGHLSARDEWRANLDAVAFANEQDFV